MPSIHPHINFNGNAEEAFLFYQSVFGGTFSKIVRFKDIAGPEFPIPQDELEKIMHIALPIGEHGQLTGNDVPSILGKVNEQEHRSKISIGAESKDEAETIFEKLSAGGEVEMPFSEGAPGSFFGMLRDKFGIEWMVQVYG